MSIFPVLDLDTTSQLESAKELPLFKEYAYDYTNNCLLRKNGMTYFVSGNEALKIWIFKALHTIRYKYVAYSRAYGNELKSLMGQPIQKDILFPELQRFIVETLLTNPYIKSLHSFKFETAGAKVTVDFTCVTLYGTIEYQHLYEGGE